MSFPTYYLSNCVSINVKVDHNKYSYLSFNKVVYETKNCLVLESVNKNIILKLMVSETEEQTIENEKIILKEYNLLKKYSDKKENYFIKVFNVISSIRMKLDTQKFKNYCLVSGYTMEKMEKDLKTVFIERKNGNKPLSDYEVFIYLKKLLKILDYMQSEGLCHRDIKLQNIFIDKKGKIKLGDFGTSRELNLKNKKFDDDKRRINYENQNLFSYVGTECYMPPEIYFYKDKIDQLSYNPFKTDMFSVGVTILNLMTLKLNKLHDIFFEDLIKYKQELTNITIKFSEKFKRALFRMLEFNERLRPEISSFYKNEFPQIFKEDINQMKDKNHLSDQQTNLNLSLKNVIPKEIKREENTMINIKIVQDFRNSGGKNKEDDLNQENTLPIPNNASSFIKSYHIENISSNHKFNIFEEEEKNNNEYYKLMIENAYSIIEESKIKEYINQGKLILYDPNSIYFRNSNNSSFTRQIKPLTFIGIYKGRKCIYKKISFSNKGDALIFSQEINFLLNKIMVTQNDSLVKYFSLIKEGSSFYIISEYVSSPLSPKTEIEQFEFYNLSSFIKKEIKLANLFKKDEIEVKKRIIRSVIDAMFHLKKNCNICFADIDLRKILISSSFQVKLKDYFIFDTAFKFNSLLGSSSNVFVSKTHFNMLPPEFYVNYICKEKSDIWGLGVLIYQLFTYGRNPWNVSDIGNYLVKVILNTASDYFKIDYHNIPSEFVQIIRNCLKRNFEERISLNKVIEILNRLN